MENERTVRGADATACERMRCNFNLDSGRLEWLTLGAQRSFRRRHVSDKHGGRVGGLRVPVGNDVGQFVVDTRQNFVEFARTANVSFCRGSFLNGKF